MVTPSGLASHMAGPLADLGVALIEHELSSAKKRLEETRARHEAAVSRVEQHDSGFKMEEEEWTASQMQRHREHDAACLLQNWWLRVGMRRMQLVPLMDILEQQRLQLAKRQLDTVLLDLRHCVHGLHIEESDRQTACLKIQHWWRRVLAQRVMKVIAFYGTVRKVKQQMEEAASKIQALYRGVCARRLVQGMRESKQVAEAEAEVRMEKMKMQAILSIQNSYRKSVAVKQVQLLRAQMFAAMMSQGGAGADAHHLGSKLQPNSSRPLWFKANKKADTRKKR